MTRDELRAKAIEALFRAPPVDSNAQANAVIRLVLKAVLREVAPIFDGSHGAVPIAFIEVAVLDRIRALMPRMPESKS